MTAPDLATLIETSPPSRDLADRVLLACGWTRGESWEDGWIWNSPTGETMLERPDPLTDLNAVAALEWEARAVMTIGHDDDGPQAGVDVHCSVPCKSGGYEFADSFATGPHAECRARADALVRALVAAGRLG